MSDSMSNYQYNPYTYTPLTGTQKAAAYTSLFAPIGFGVLNFVADQVQKSEDRKTAEKQATDTNILMIKQLQDEIVLKENTIKTTNKLLTDTQAELVATKAMRDMYMQMAVQYQQLYAAELNKNKVTQQK